MYYCCGILAALPSESSLCAPQRLADQQVRTQPTRYDMFDGSGSVSIASITSPERLRSVQGTDSSPARGPDTTIKAVVVTHLPYYVI